MWMLSDKGNGITFKCDGKVIDLSSYSMAVEKIESWGDVVLNVDGIDGFLVVMVANGRVKVPLEYNDLIPLELFPDWLNRQC